MKHTKVGTVMTNEVVTAAPGTSFKEIARLLAVHRVSGLPVLDDDDKVVGVVSGTDLLRTAGRTAPAGRANRLRARLNRLVQGRRRTRKAPARHAGTLMSSPAVTVRAESTIADAARTMARRGIERLPVVDEEDRLVGIVTRRDLLQVFLRPDEEIRRTVLEEVIDGTPWLAPQSVAVEVRDGVVTLAGQVERLSEKPVALRMASRIDGVVAVVDRLTHRVDDTRLRPAGWVPREGGGSWLREF
ncbi:CBS domain-containing protein [Streptomyces sp. GMY02]|uniref:BON domain-containing protein n=1 Tax=Streptomyces sp. GMY02 TaxID=1333528 RepID=UPI001C2C4C61|nr:CBS domain-containing protein [Streptomyces sp. GMY02]QXE35035.1 CBS domain-containing protein [Streptomyces sp. GMY02]